MKLICTLPAALDVFEMTFEGVEYVVIAKADLKGLYEPASEKRALGPQPVLAKSRKPRSAKTPKVAKAAEEPRKLSAPVQEAIVSLLGKRPMTSLEIVEAMKSSTPACVYTTLSALRKRGDIETKLDAHDGIRKNYLKARAA